VKLHADYVRRQMEVLAEQARELSRRARTATPETEESKSR
jgi:hypothetical protein